VYPKIYKEEKPATRIVQQASVGLPHHKRTHEQKGGKGEDQYRNLRPKTYLGSR
jgi:hypothetical protein